MLVKFTSLLEEYSKKICKFVEEEKLKRNITAVNNDSFSNT